MPWLRSATVLFSRSRLRECKIRYLSFHNCNSWYKYEYKVIKPLNSSKVVTCLCSPANFYLGFSLSNVLSNIEIRHTSTNERSYSEFNFEKECEETLESLSEHFEELLEGNCFGIPLFLAWHLYPYRLSTTSD